MNRERFTTELRQALEGHLQEKDIHEILSDYQEFFDAGLAEGNSEEQVAERLGDPAKIALSLLRKDSPPEAEVKIPKAKVYRRITAFLVDVLVTALPFLWFAPRTGLVLFFMPGLLLVMLPSLLSTVTLSSHSWIALIRPFWTAGVLLSAMWFLFLNSVLLIVFRGQTLGKRLSGLRIVRRSGGRATAGQYFAREVLAKLGLNALCGLIWLPLAFVPALVSLVWSLLSPEGMTLWDAIAGTRVVEARFSGKED